MSYELIQDLTESRLLRTKQSFKTYTAKDIAELAFVYFISLEILSSEFDYLSDAKDYAKKTIMYGNFNSFRFSGTDMYMLLYVLLGNDEVELKGDKENNDLFLNNINPNMMNIKRYFLNLRKGEPNQTFNRRFLLKLQQELDITVANYRSMRILVSDWKNISKPQKKLVMTRLLQVFRARAIRSELRTFIESLAKGQKLEIKGVDNAETGKEGKGIKDPDFGTTKKKTPWWAKTAAAGAGAYGGYKLTSRGKKS